MKDLGEMLLQYIKEQARQQGESKGALTINEIISRLKEIPEDTPVCIDYKTIFDYEEQTYSHEIMYSDFVTYSWRGSYNLPAIDPQISNNNITVKEVNQELENNEGKMVYGYKGGDFVLSNDSFLFIAHYGNDGNSTAVIDVIEKDNIVILVTDVDMY